MSMPREADKHIRVTEETWLDLNKKKRPGDSFDDVLQRLLDEDREETTESDL
jgi:predicted CopG family antitoxin